MRRAYFLSRSILDSRSPSRAYFVLERFFLSFADMYINRPREIRSAQTCLASHSSFRLAPFFQREARVLEFACLQRRQNAAIGSGSRGNARNAVTDRLEFFEF